MSVPTATTLLIFDTSNIDLFRSSFLEDFKESKLPLISIIA